MVRVRRLSRGVTVDSVQASGRVALGPSTVGELTIDRAAIEGAYRDGAGDIRQFDLEGRDLHVQASGALALNATGESNLKVHADTPDLEAVLKLAGQSATGIAMVEATITGNRGELHATGKLSADNVAYGNTSALEMSSDFDVTVPNLAFGDAEVSATTSGTFVEIAGQEINELTAKTGYSGHQVVFDATAKQPKRVLNAAGSIAFDPEQDELKLNRLSLQTQNIAWETPPNTQATIQFGGGAVSVEDLRLVNGTQEISAAATFGRPNSKLTVSARDMNLATVDALMLRGPMLSGTLNGTADITGTTAGPRVAGKFNVAQGAFRKVPYDALGGTVDYAGKGLTIDAKLQQSPRLDRSEGTSRRGVKAAADERRPSDRGGGSCLRPPYQQHAVDLGLVQGLTTALHRCEGNGSVKIGGDPHPRYDHRRNAVHGQADCVTYTISTAVG